MLVHEIAQSGGKIRFFQRQADGLYLGSAAGIVSGAKVCAVTASANRNADAIECRNRGPSGVGSHVLVNGAPAVGQSVVSLEEDLQLTVSGNVVRYLQHSFLRIVTLFRGSGTMFRRSFLAAIGSLALLVVTTSAWHSVSRRMFPAFVMFRGQGIVQPLLLYHANVRTVPGPKGQPVADVRDDPVATLYYSL